MGADLLGDILIIVFLVVITAFFSASEMAIISLNDTKVKHQADEGDKKAKIINRLTQEPSKFLATVQIAITLSGLMSSAIVALITEEYLPKMIQKWNIPVVSSSSKGIAVFVGTLVISYILLVVGELAPKRLALEKAENISRFVAGPIETLSKIASPFVKMLTVSTNFVVRLLGGNPESVNQEKITEEEIRMMINVGEEKGVLMESEREMIDSIFEFDDTLAKEVMTPRVDMVCVSVDATLNEVMDIAVKEQFSRMPVFEETIDNIIGILNLKDLFEVFKFKKEEVFSVKNYLRPALFVPENQKIDDILKRLQAERTEIAIVIDEYGGIAGLITTEDLIEEIVGNILDEYDEEENKEIEKIDDNTYIVNGLLPIGQLNAELDINLPEEGADTIGGFVLGILGRIPESEEKPTIEYEDYVFKIEEMEERRVEKVKIGIDKKIDQDSSDLED